MNILEAIKTKKIYFDGGFGTMLQDMGLLNIAGDADALPLPSVSTLQ